jgi:hypothetical protein
MDILRVFTTRELATGLWLFAFLVWAFTYGRVRESFGHVLKSLLHWKLSLMMALATVYVTAVVAILYAVGFWTVALSKDTVVWFLFGGIGAAFARVGAAQHTSIIREILSDALKVWVLVEYVTSVYTFPLAVEILLVPFVAVLAVLDVVARTDEHYTPVRKLILGIQVVIGATVLGFALKAAVADFQSLRTLETLRSMLLAPILSLAFAPFLYALLLTVAYENLFIRLRLGGPKSDQLARYAKRRLFQHLGLRLTRVQSFLQNHGQALMHARDPVDIDALLT